MDFGIVMWIIAIVVVGLISGTIWLIIRGFMFIAKIFYYIFMGLVWLVMLPFKRGE
jgi:hypothetical protein